MPVSEVFFVTNRNEHHLEGETNDFGASVHPRGLQYLRFGRANVRQDIEPQFKLYPEEDDGSVLGSAAAFDALRTRMKEGKKDTLVYIHGYNTSFAKSLKTGARLASAFSSDGSPLNVIVFSWPSDGAVAAPRVFKTTSAYYSDQKDAEASGAALARFLLKASDFVRGLSLEEACSRRVHVLAHSMGNQVLRCGLREALRFSPGHRLRQMFHHVFLCAADVDNDCFSSDFLALGDLAQQTDVYFNQNDGALGLSDSKNPIPRLGRSGPRLPLAVPGGVALVNATGVVGEEHSYMEHAKVAADIKRTLSGCGPGDHGDNRRYVASQNHYVLV